MGKVPKLRNVRRGKKKDTSIEIAFLLSSVTCGINAPQKKSHVSSSLFIKTTLVTVFVKIFLPTTYHYYHKLHGYFR